jgi:hypothetical protein
MILYDISDNAKLINFKYLKITFENHLITFTFINLFNIRIKILIFRSHFQKYVINRWLCAKSETLCKYIYGNIFYEGREWNKASIEIVNNVSAMIKYYQ